MSIRKSSRVLSVLTILAISAAVASGARAAAAGDLAKQIGDATGVKAGLIVHVGCGDGELTAALGDGGRCVVEGLSGDAQRIAAARKRFQTLGVSEKVWARQWSGPRLPYTNNLVNLIVSEDLGAVTMDEVTRVLAPLGTAYLKGKDGAWTKSVKPWPQDIDEWTHYLHGADNNAVAKDRVAGPPACAQWVEGPLWYQHHQMIANPEALVSAKGRIFYIYNGAAPTVAGLPGQWAVAARDGFNGMLLWTKPFEDWGWKAWGNPVETGGRFALPLEVQRRMVAAGDRVFVTLGFNAPLTALDAATGEILKTYEGTQGTDEILFSDGLLILTVNESTHTPGPSLPPAKKRIMVVNADTGQTLWAKGGYAGVPASAAKAQAEGVNRLLLAAGEGKVVGADKDGVIAFDLKTGQELWRTPRPARPAPTERSAPKGKVREPSDNFSSLVVCQGVTLFLQTLESYDAGELGKRGVQCKLLGLANETGKVLWEQPCSKWGPGAEGDVFAIAGLAWTYSPDGYSAIGIDLHSGQIKRTISAKAIFDEVHHHRCYRNKATECYLFPGRRGVEAIDLQTGANYKNQWVRGTCRYGIMPCNGLIYAPPHACACYIEEKLSGFYALASEAAALRGGPEPQTGGRIERGPAFGQTGASPAAGAPSPEDWPTYRHDARRSGSTSASAPANLKRLWAAPLGGRVSACTIASGRVYAAAVDQHRVVALDEKDGRVVWDYVADGRVDTPPTVYKDLLLFGSADGSAYCLRASDGALAWRFQAAPGERRIMAFGQLESPWPVHGTVLVNNGVAYVAAGRSTHLDGGIRVYALKPETGELIRQLKPLNQDPEGLEDVLVSDGNHVFMRHLEFGLAADGASAPAASPARALAQPNPHAYSSAGLLDDSCFNRMGWSTGKAVSKLGDAEGVKARGNKAQRASQTPLAKAADLLVFDDATAFCYRTKRQGSFGGWFQAGAGAYELAALNQAGKPRWAETLPLRVRALAATAQTVFAAGPRDVVNPKDPWGAIEGREGGALWAISKQDGKKLAEYPLEKAPAWDGLAVANNRLFLSTLGGEVICMGEN